METTTKIETAKIGINHYLKSALMAVKYENAEFKEVSDKLKIETLTATNSLITQVLAKRGVEVRENEKTTQLTKWAEVNIGKKTYIGTTSACAGYPGLKRDGQSAGIYYNIENPEGRIIQFSIQLNTRQELIFNNRQESFEDSLNSWIDSLTA